MYVCKKIKKILEYTFCPVQLYIKIRNGHKKHQLFRKFKKTIFCSAKRIFENMEHLCINGCVITLLVLRLKQVGFHNVKLGPRRDLIYSTLTPSNTTFGPSHLI